MNTLPVDDTLRIALHNEVHARPSARVRLPALIVFVAVLNEGVSREQECEHLRQLPGHGDLPLDSLQAEVQQQGPQWVVPQLQAALGREAPPLLPGATEQREVTVMAEKSLPYAVLRKIVASSSAAEYTKVSLAVVEREQAFAGLAGA